MDFSDFIFYLKTFKINKKIAKSARVPRGCDVACKATWQSLRGAFYIYIVYLLLL